MLYEPTNINPSTFTQTGTVASSDNVEIQWQVNGNSALSMFQIDVMQNDALSEFVCSTNIIRNNPTSGTAYALPFHGKNRLGQIIPFLYAPSSTWGAWSNNKIEDGNSYKFNITQFYAGENIGIRAYNLNQTARTAYVTYQYNGNTVYVYYTIPTEIELTVYSSFYYSFTQQVGWIFDSSIQRLVAIITCGVSNTVPEGYTQNNSVGSITSDDIFYNQLFISQKAPSVFITRTQPTLSIESPVNGIVTSAIQLFNATYSQAQGDEVVSVRWQLYNVTENEELVDDTGEINTGVLSYEYNGLFDEQTYRLVCTVETANNVSISADLSFSVEYTAATYDGDFNIHPICSESANLLAWEPTYAIYGVAQPEGAANIENGELILPSQATVEWAEYENEEGEKAQLNFSSPWTAVVKNYTGSAELNKSGDIIRNGIALSALCCEFNPEGNLCVVGGIFSGHAALFSVANGALTYIQDIRKGNTVFNGNVNFAKFSPNGKFLVLGGEFSGGLSYFTVAGTTLTYQGDLTYNGVAITEAELGTFNFDSSLFIAIVSQNSTQVLLTYLVSENSITYLVSSNLIEEESISPNFICLSPTGGIGVIGGASSPSGSASSIIISLSANGAITAHGALQYNNQDAYAIMFSGDFNPAGTLFAVYWQTLLVLYRVDGTSFTNVGDTPITKGVNMYGAIKFTPDGNFLALSKGRDNADEGGLFLFSVLGENIRLIDEASFRTSQSSENGRQAMSINPADYSLAMGSPYGSEAPAELWQIDIKSQSGQLFSIQGNNLSVSRNDDLIICYLNDTSLGQVQIGASFDNPIDEIIVALMPEKITVYSFFENTYVGQASSQLSYTQQALNSIKVFGPQTYKYVLVVDGDGSNIEQHLADPEFIPRWNDPLGYNAELYANFLYGIDGGSATQTGIGYRLYRRDIVSANIQTPIATLPSTTTSIKDYGIKSGTQYVYDFYAYDATGAFMGVKSSSPITQRFRAFSLLSTQYNSDDGCYHVEKEYRFSCNVQDMAVTNNSNKQYSQNFTPYPTVFRSTANYASGTLQALIGFVDKKYYKYWDSTALMSELRGLSTTTNTLFLKDKKGQIWMVDVGAVTLTATQKTREMQVTISLPWTEIGDAENVSIIQTPDDETWNSSTTQVLDATFDVETGTGKLKSVSPYSYNSIGLYRAGEISGGQTSFVRSLPETLRTLTTETIASNRR